MRKLSVCLLLSVIHEKEIFCPLCMRKKERKKGRKKERKKETEENAKREKGKEKTIYSPCRRLSAELVDIIVKAGGKNE